MSTDERTQMIEPEDIRLIRSVIGCTRRDLGFMMGRSEAAISSMETRRRGITGSALHTLREIMRSPEFLRRVDRLNQLALMANRDDR